MTRPRLALSGSILLVVAVAASSCRGRSTSPPATVERVPGRPIGSYLVPAGIHKIKHVIVIQQENRSFNSYFGTFPGADGIPMKSGKPAVCVTDPGTGACVAPYVDHADVNGGCPHSAVNATADVNGGKKDGVIGQAQSGRKGCLDPTDHLGQDQLGQDDRGHHIGLEVTVDQPHGRVEQLVHVARSDVAAVVHQHVDPVPALQDGGDRNAERGPVEQVEVDGKGTPARVLDQGGGRVQRSRESPGVGLRHRRGVLALFPLVEGPGTERHVEAGLGQVDGDLLPDTSARASDQGDTPGLYVVTHF